MQPIGSAAT